MDFDFARSHIGSGGGHIGSFNTIQNTSFVLQALPLTKEKKASELKRCPLPSRTFAGRDDILGQLTGYFFQDGGEKSQSPRLRSFVLWGMGGSGKSQIAYKFVHDIVIPRITKVYFIDATTTETLDASFKEIASASGLEEEKKETILNHLANMMEDWFLFFNNADDASIDLNQFFPQTNRGRILITTRNRDSCQRYASGGEESSYHVSRMPIDDAVTLLLHSSRLASSSSKSQGANVLVQELGCLPLALAQAGASIFTLGISISDYIELYKTRRFSILQSDLRVLDGYQETVQTTFGISYARLSALARQILHLCSFLHHDGITQAMFMTAIHQISSYTPIVPLREQDTEALTTLGNLLENFQTEPTSPKSPSFASTLISRTYSTTSTWDEVKFMEIMHELRSYSLVDYDEETRLYSIHPLVHSWTQELSAREGFQPAAQLFLRLSMPNAIIHDIKDYALRQKYLPHVVNVLRDWDMSELNVDAAEAFASVYCDAGRYEVGLSLYSHVLQRQEDAYGEDDPSTIATMARIASTLQDIGRPAESESLQEKVLEKRRKILGEDHDSTLETMHEMAEILKQKGRWKEAEELEIQVVEKRRQSAGEDDTKLLASLYRLAEIYSAQGRWVEAVKSLHQVWEKSKQVLGTDHPQSLVIAASIGQNYLAQKHLSEAETLLTEASSTLKEVVGEDHPYTLRALNVLANVWLACGKAREAGTLFESILPRLKANLGVNHPTTINTMYNLSAAYADQNQLDEATNLTKDVIERRTMVLGEQHRDTLSAMCYLGALYSNQNRWKEAEALQVKVLEARKALFASDHPDVLKSMEYLSFAYQRQQLWELAQPLHAQVLEAYRQTRGEDHTDTLSAMSTFAWIISLLGRSAEGEELQRKVLHKMTILWGKDHLSTMQAMHTLAMIARSRGHLKEVEILQIEVLQWRKKTLGSEHRSTLDTMSDLSRTWYEMGKTSEAEELALEALEMWKKTLGLEHPDTLLAMQILGVAYSNMSSKHAEGIQLLELVYETKRRLIDDTHRQVLISGSYLANAYLKQGRRAEAEDIHTRAIQLRKETFGESDPETLYAIECLASMLCDDGRWAEARPLYAETIEGWKRHELFGEDHPVTQSAMVQLARTFNTLDLLDDADRLLVAVLEKRNASLGPKHRATVLIMHNLSFTRSRQHRFQEAETLLLAVTEEYKASLGPDNASTLFAMKDLAFLYAKTGKEKKAEVILVDTLEKMKVTLGEAHLTTLMTMYCLAMTLQIRLQNKKAKNTIQQMIDICNRHFGEDHPRTLTALSQLGAHSVLLNRWKEGGEIHFRVMEKRMRVLGVDHPDTITSMASVAQCYGRQGKYVEAEALQATVVQKRSASLGEQHKLVVSDKEQLTTYTKALQRERSGSRVQRWSLRSEEMMAKVKDVII